MERELAAWRRKLVEVAAELPAAAELGALVSGAVGSLVRHERLHLLGLDPASGMTSFPIGYDADGLLAVDQLCGYYLGDDRHRPSVLAGRHRSACSARPTARSWPATT